MMVCDLCQKEIDGKNPLSNFSVLILFGEKHERHFYPVVSAVDRENGSTPASLRKMIGEKEFKFHHLCQQCGEKIRDEMLCHIESTLIKYFPYLWPEPTKIGNGV